MSSKGLGRGLDALLRRTDMGAARQEKNDTPEKETGTEHSPTLLPLSHLHANPSQPRQTFDAVFKSRSMAFHARDILVCRLAPAGVRIFDLVALRASVAWIRRIPQSVGSPR